MKPEQKNQLEQIFSQTLQASIAKDDFSIIPLIEFAKSHELYFDEYYEGLFLAKLVGLEYKKGCQFIKQFSLFGIDECRIGELCEPYFLQQFQIKLITKQPVARYDYKGNVLFYESIAEIIDPLKDLMDSRIVFDNKFWNSSELNKAADQETIKIFKEKNSYNYTLYMEKVLPENFLVEAPVKI